MERRTPVFPDAMGMNAPDRPPFYWDGSLGTALLNHCASQSAFK